MALARCPPHRVRGPEALVALIAALLRRRTEHGLLPPCTGSDIRGGSRPAGDGTQRFAGTVAGIAATRDRDIDRSARRGDDASDR